MAGLLAARRVHRMADAPMTNFAVVGLGYGDEGKGSTALLQPGSGGTEPCGVIPEVAQTNVALIAENAADALGAAEREGRVVVAAPVVVVDMPPSLSSRLGGAADATPPHTGVVPVHGESAALQPDLDAAAEVPGGVRGVGRLDGLTLPVGHNPLVVGATPFADRRPPGSPGNGHGSLAVNARVLPRDCLVGVPHTGGGAVAVALSVLDPSGCLGCVPAFLAVRRGPPARVRNLGFAAAGTQSHVVDTTGRPRIKGTL